MENLNFYLKLFAALLLSISSVTLLTTSAVYAGYIAGVAVISSLALIKSAERSSRKTGRDDRMKVALITSTILYEIIFLIGASSLSIFPDFRFSVFAPVVALGAVAFVEILHVEAERSLRTTFTKDIGREGRMAVLAASLVAFEFNSYYLFYGLLFIAFLAIYDSLRLIHQLYREL